MTVPTKSELRTRLRVRYQGREVRDLESRQICQHILSSSIYRQAGVVGGYIPLAHEADITPVLMDVLSSGRTLALPQCVAAHRMAFHRVTYFSDLLRGTYGLLEPGADTEVVPAESMDLLLVPLEGISPAGVRLGKGGGVL